MILSIFRVSFYLRKSNGYKIIESCSYQTAFFQLNFLKEPDDYLKRDIKMSELGKLIRYNTVRISVLYGASILSAVNKLLDIVPEVLIGIAVDIVVNKQSSLIAKLGVYTPVSQLIALAGITFFVWLLESLTEYAHLKLWKNIAQELQHSLRMRVYSHLQSLEMAYFDTKSAGEISSILTEDIHQLERFFDGGANAIIHFIVSTLAIGLIFLYLAPWAAVFTFLPIPFIMVIAFLFKRRLSSYYKHIRQKVGILISQSASSIAGIATVKSYNAEDYEIKRLEEMSLSYQQAYKDVIRLSSLFTPLIRMLIVAGFMAALVIGGISVIQGTLAVGSYTVLVFLTQRFLWPFVRWAELLELYERTNASAYRILQLLEENPAPQEGTQIVRKDRVKGSIEFKAVSFAYSNGVEIFKDFSFYIPAGTTVAFVGGTGSGKSTIARLLLRFYSFQQGAILLDGVDIRNYTPQSIRAVISYISQEIVIINGTVKENIAYGSWDASQAAIEEAARKAQAYDFIMQLSQGFDTLLGDYGRKLSGGQRQRIAIARALLKDAHLIIFDEATSAVDNETEKAIHCTLENVVKGRTTLIIAHRLTTVRNADIIFVLDKGVLIESGTHEHLLFKNGLYSRLWRLQTGEAICKE